MVREAADKEAKKHRGQITCGQKYGNICQDAAQRREKQEWAIETPKLDNARKLRGISFIDPTDAEFKGTIKNARKKLEVPMPASVPCKIRRSKCGETCSSSGTRNTTRPNMHASLKPTNLRESVWKELHIMIMKTTLQEKASKHKKITIFVHKFIPMPQAMKIRDVKAAVKKEWGNSRKNQHGS